MSDEHGLILEWEDWRAEHGHLYRQTTEAINAFLADRRPQGSDDDYPYCSRHNVADCAECRGGSTPEMPPAPKPRPTDGPAGCPSGREGSDDHDARHDVFDGA